MAKFKVWGACATGGVALLAIVGSLVSAPAYAGVGKPKVRVVERQRDPGLEIIRSVELRQVPVREALNALFGKIGVSYSISSEVQGKVTLSLRDVTFHVALMSILRQVNATIRMGGGVYNIVSREGPPEPLSPSEVAVIQEASIPSSVSSDRDYLYVARANKVYKVRRSDL